MMKDYGLYVAHTNKYFAISERTELFDKAQSLMLRQVDKFSGEISGVR